MTHEDAAEILAEAVVAQNERMDAIELGSQLSKETYAAIVAAARRVKANSEQLRADVDELMERVVALEAEVRFTPEELK